MPSTFDSNHFPQEGAASIGPGNGKVPATSMILSSLLKADFTAQWRNRRAFILMLLVPVIILISWKGVIERMGGVFALASCLTIGLTSIGLMGYSNSLARDRDKGIFQRLRVAPVPTWSIMFSRLLVQMAMILLMTTGVFLAGYYLDRITISPSGYILSFLTVFAGGAVYLGLGQMIVGLIKNAENVNAVTRLVYFLFIVIGMFGETGMLGNIVGEIVKWSPYGAVKRLLAASMDPSGWSMQSTLNLLLTMAYAGLFTFLGIRRFRWDTR